MIRFAAAIAILATSSDAQQSTDQSPDAGSAFCERLDGLAGSVGDPDLTKSFTLGNTEAPCSHSRGMNGTAALHCAWPYDYRAVLATDDFDALKQMVSDCAELIVADASTVSHPDSYDLQQFQFGAGTVSVSLKDKAALSQSYVFLRVELPASP